MEDRFIDLEIRIGQQEYMIDSLNQIIYKQQGKIDQIEAALAEVAKRIANLDSGISSSHDRPPHY